MASLISELISSVGLDTKQIETIQWGEICENGCTGIYFVSTSKSPCQNLNIFDQVPIDDSVLTSWLNQNTLIIDGTKAPTLDEIKHRLSRFWLPDENIIFIGKTKGKQTMNKRIKSLYSTKFDSTADERWINVLSITNQLFIHYISCNSTRMDLSKIEVLLLRRFVGQVSDSTKNILSETDCLIPFANLSLGLHNKRLGISKQNTKKVKKSIELDSTSQIKKSGLICPDTQKIIFVSKKEAKIEINRILGLRQENKKPVRMYLCQKCRWWHLTSKSYAVWKEQNCSE